MPLRSRERVSVASAGIGPLALAAVQSPPFFVLPEIARPAAAASAGSVQPRLFFKSFA